eukprot:30965-Pelagococcus_subviridis.AAC.8
MPQRVDDVLALEPQVDDHLERLRVHVRRLRERIRRRHREVPRQVHDEPRVRPNLRYRDPLQRVHEEHPRDQVSRPRREMRRKVINAPLDLLEQVRYRLVVERQRPAQERVQDDAAGPHVHLGAAVQLAAEGRGSIRAMISGWS